MKVSGFTFLRNAVLNGYPFEESIRSLLPIVDEYIVAVGNSDDETLSRVLDIDSPKIRVIETQWNESMRDRGFVYGQQKMIAQYQCTGDWAFYLEGDEVLHEDEVEQILSTMQKYDNDRDVEALYFDFYHFYGTAQQVGIAGYRRAPRIIRNTIRTIAPDGLFWVVMDRNKKGRYPKARHAGGNIYHYGHCRSVEKMNEKLRRVRRYWGADHEQFAGYGSIDPSEIRVFEGSHPKVMERWIADESESEFSIDPNYRLTRRDRRNRFRFWVEERFGIEISKKHYQALDRL